MYDTFHYLKVCRTPRSASTTLWSLPYFAINACSSSLTVVPCIGRSSFFSYQLFRIEVFCVLYTLWCTWVDQVFIPGSLSTVQFKFPVQTSEILHVSLDFNKDKERKRSDEVCVETSLSGMVKIILSIRRRFRESLVLRLVYQTYRTSVTWAQFYRF